MKKLYLVFTLLLIFAFTAGKAMPKGGAKDNTLTKKEKKAGWSLLFDGQTSAGWMNAKTKTFPSSGWEIKDGTLTINPASKKQGGGGDIVTVDKFKNFELKVDFKYTKGANSGIKYYIDTETNNCPLDSIGSE